MWRRSVTELTLSMFQYSFCLLSASRERLIAVVGKFGGTKLLLLGDNSFWRLRSFVFLDCKVFWDWFFFIFHRSWIQSVKTTPAAYQTWHGLSRKPYFIKIQKNVSLTPTFWMQQLENKDKCMASLVLFSISPARRFVWIILFQFWPIVIYNNWMRTS